MAKNKKTTKRYSKFMNQRCEIFTAYNLFQEKLQNSLQTFGAKEAFYFINESGKIDLFFIRPKLTRIVFDKSLGLSSFEKKHIQKRLNTMLQNTYITINGEKVSVYEANLYYMPVFLLYKSFKERSFTNKEQFIKLLPGLQNSDEGMQEMLDKTFEAVKTLHAEICAKTKNIVALERYEQKLSINNLRFTSDFKFTVAKRQYKSVEINKQKRTAYELILWTEKRGTHSPKITAEKFGISGWMNKLPISVFFLDHAYNRFHERLGFGASPELYKEVTNAFQNPQLTRVGFTQYLLEFSLNGQKAGYFRGDLNGDKFIVRTFLFLTNNGTPEGDKLTKLLGINKIDKEYWKLGKLQTYFNSDIGENATLREIYAKAGCNSIFNIVDSQMYKHTSEGKELKLSHRLLDYVQYNELENITA